MLSAPGELSRVLVALLTSLLVATPLIVTLLVSAIICWRQRERRPQTARLMGWATLGYLIWTAVGLRIYTLVIMLMGLNFTPQLHGEFVWILKTIALGLIPATLYAIIWGCALWSILMIDEYQDARL